ncbi:MAG: hypothetical protein ACFFD4_14975 [Candidatus Odinarchaeota archaeon]
MRSLEYDPQVLKKTEEDFNARKMHIDPTQFKIVKDFAGILHGYVDMNEMPLRGFIYLALRKWQIIESKPVSTVVTMEPEERMVVVSKMIEILRMQLHNVLQNDNQTEMLDEGLDAAFAYYKEKYAFRPPR